MELSKAAKKMARFLIDKGIQIEYQQTLEKTEAILTEGRSGAASNLDTYMKLYEHVSSADKQPGRNYDRMTGSNYLFIVAAQCRRGLVSAAALELFSDPVRDAILCLGKAEIDE